VSVDIANFAGAIAALSTAIESMESRQRALATQLSATKKNRRDQLDQRVLKLLPEIASTTMDLLKREVPDFLRDQNIRAAIEKNKKVLWLFKPSAYDQTLLLLRTQMKFFLERQGLASADDATIQRLEADIALLAKQQSDALEVLRLMEKAHRSNTRLPPDAVVTINKVAERGRGLLGKLTPQNTPAARYLSEPQPSASHSSSESNTDLWLWMMTDIPTSFRTLMLSSFSHHHDSSANHQSTQSLAPGGGDFGGGGASGDFPQPVTSDLSAPIATDDSLGVFS